MTDSTELERLVAERTFLQELAHFLSGSDHSFDRQRGRSLTKLLAENRDMKAQVLRLEGEKDHYPSHEALSDLVHLLAEEDFLGRNHNWKERWDRALGVATDLVRVEP